MGISSFITGIVVGVVVTTVGLEKVIEILKEIADEAIPILLTFVEGMI